MNILMVGHSGAGKTSFMAGMYKYLGEDKDGYGIRAIKPQQKQQLERMVKLLERGQYPSSTDVQQMYNFQLTCKGEDVIPFNWMDYRGGILLSEDPDEQDMNKFMAAIQTADALVVFLDGQKLSQKTEKWSMEYDILISCIENSLDVEHQSWFPICFVITKCDMVPDGASFYGLNHFDTLFEQIQSSQSVGGMLVQCAINKESFVVPFFILAYCIYGGAPIYINKRLQAAKAAQQRAETHRPTSFLDKVFGVGEQIFKEVFDLVDMGWETEYEKTWSAEADFKKEYEHLQYLQSIADDLEEKLKDWNSKNFITTF